MKITKKEFNKLSTIALRLWQALGDQELISFMYNLQSKKKQKKNNKKSPLTPIGMSKHQEEMPVADYDHCAASNVLDCAGDLTIDSSTPCEIMVKCTCGAKLKIMLTEEPKIPYNFFDPINTSY